MKSTHAYFSTFLKTLIFSIVVIMHLTPKNTVEKFKFPSHHIFIGDYGNHDVIHRVTYHGLFNFGKRMQEADVLILGNSHAELGLSAKKIGQELSAKAGRRIKAMNLGVGWGEAYAFQKHVLKNNKVKCKILLLEVYETLNWDALTLIAQPVLTESKFTAYTRVFETWLITYKDWLLDGILPRVTFSDSKFSVQRFLAYPVGFRHWNTGDVWDYWFPKQGQVYRKTPSELVTYPIMIPNKKAGDVKLFQHLLDESFLKRRNLQVITTFVPTDKTDYEYYVSPPKQLGLTYIEIPNQGIELYDGGHANSVGRAAATAGLIKNWQENATAMQMLNQCRV